MGEKTQGPGRTLLFPFVVSVFLWSRLSPGKMVKTNACQPRIENSAGFLKEHGCVLFWCRRDRKPQEESYALRFSPNRGSIPQALSNRVAVAAELHRATRARIILSGADVSKVGTSEAKAGDSEAKAGGSPGSGCMALRGSLSFFGLRGCWIAFLPGSLIVLGCLVAWLIALLLGSLILVVAWLHCCLVCWLVWVTWLHVCLVR